MLSLFVGIVCGFTVSIQDGLADRIPQQHKDKIQDKLDQGKHLLTEEYFPEERRDQFIFRGKKVIVS